MTLRMQWTNEAQREWPPESRRERYRGSPKRKARQRDDEGADTTDARRAPATLDPSDAAEATDAGEPAGEANPGEDSGYGRLSRQDGLD